MHQFSDLSNLADDGIYKDGEDRRIRFGGLYDIGQVN